MKLKLLDLFSGIGGFSLGLESTGFFETIGFVEKDKFCQKVLKKHWSNINIEEDIRNVKGERYAADIITGGFPCQPFSVAGKRKSTADDRYLWDEMLRVIREVKPRWIIGENVEGIININEGMVLRQVQTDLEKEGFQSQCIIIPASGIGAWHQRKRVWIIACNISNSKYNGSYRSERNATKQSSHEQKDRLSFGDDKNVSNSSSKRSLAQSVGVNRELEKKIGGKKETRNQSSLCTSSSCSDVPNSDSKLSNGCSSSTRFSSTKLSGLECNEEGNRNKVWCETERCSEQNKSTYKTWWQTESKLCGIPNGLSTRMDRNRTNRIKALGNSIVPQIARELGLAIMKAELIG
jgi:DNA (cytosine-5)-methyltransferase 1